jgi:TP901 family phage tail tape measure protein
MDVARLLVEVDANTAAAEAGLASLHKQVALAAIGFGVIGVAALAAGAVAVHMAGDFQMGLTQLVTGAGLASGDVGKVGEAIKQMALDTGTSTKQLIAGMYMISSAGFNTAQSLAILQAAAEGAKVGNADLGTVADATTTIMKDYPGVINGAAGAVNFLIATVAHGKTHMEDLAASLSHVLPTAAAAGIGLQDVMAAMATMTGEGTDAANAATYLRMTILSLVAPGALAKKTLLEVGLSSDQIAAALQDPNRGLVGALTMISDAVGKKFPVGSAAYLAAMKEIAGGSKTMQGMIELTGKHLKDLQGNLTAVSGAVQKGGKDVTGWSDIQKDFNLQLSKLREMLEVAFISLGQHLLPVLTNVVKFIVANAVPAVQRLTQFWKDHQAIIIIVAALIGGALAAAFIVWAATAAAAAVATIAATWPVLAIGAAIALLVLGIIWAYKNWGWFRDILNVVKNVLGDVAGFIGDQVIPRLGALAGFIGANVGNAFKAFGAGIQTIINFFQDLLDIIGRVIGAIGNVAGAAGNAASAVGNFISNIHLPGFASGTGFTPGGPFIGAEQGPELLLRPGIYTAPRGSTVLNAQDTRDVLMGKNGRATGPVVNIYTQKANLDPDDLQTHLRRQTWLSGAGRG